MICLGSVMLIVMAHVATPAYAADANVAAESAPDFIEFLGEWETPDGAWVDPNELAPEADTSGDGELDLTPEGETIDD